MKLHALASIATIGLAAALSPAWAADDHKGHDHDNKGGAHAHEAKPRFGGVVTVVKDVNYELVAKPKRWSSTSATTASPSISRAHRPS